MPTYDFINTHTGEEWEEFMTIADMESLLEGNPEIQKAWKTAPAIAGDHLLKEINNIDSFLQNSKKPNMAIIGGSKISSKINLLNNLIEQFSTIAIGGAMANTFLLANQNNIGNRTN